MLAFLLAISDERHHKTVSHIFKSYHSDMLKLARYKLRGQENFKELAEDAVENALLKITKYVNNGLYCAINFTLLICILNTKIEYTTISVSDSLIRKSAI